MNRKSLLSIFLCLILGIALLSGCGGGGGKKTPENCLSSDYFGLEVNYTLTYNCFLDNPEYGYNDFSYTTTHTVLSEDSDVYKTQKTFSAEPGYGYGDYIEKNADGYYYDRGEWETGEDDYFCTEPYPIIFKNPLSSDFSCWRYGTVVGQENVTVPAGTFYAWKFVDPHEGVNWTDVSEYYFVENIGLVKYESTETENGDIVFYQTWSLTSYYLSSSTNSANLSINSSTNSGTFKKLQKIMRNKR